MFGTSYDSFNYGRWVRPITRNNLLIGHRSHRDNLQLNLDGVLLNGPK